MAKSKLKTNAQWVHVIFIENYFNSYNKRDGSGKTHIFTLHLRGIDKQDMTAKLFCHSNEDGELVANPIFTQLWFAKYKPALLVKYRNARQKRHTKDSDEILELLRNKSKELGIRLQQEREDFIDEVNREFQGLQFRILWQAQGLTSIGAKVEARPASALVNIMPVGKNNLLDKIGDMSLTSFIEAHRKGSIEERTDAGMNDLDEFDDVFDFDVDDTGGNEEKESKELDVNGVDENDVDDVSLNY